MGPTQSKPRHGAEESDNKATLIAQTPYRFAILAVGGVSLIMTWVTLNAGIFGQQSITGWEADIGKIYFSILVAILLVELIGSLKHVRKAWLVGGGLLFLSVLGQISHTQSVMNEIEAEAAAEGMGGMVGLSFGAGLYLSLAVSIVVMFIGYHITSDSVRPVFEDEMAPVRESLGDLKKALSHSAIQPKYGSWSETDVEAPAADEEDSPQHVEFNPTSAIRMENDSEPDADQDRPSGKM